MKKLIAVLIIFLSVGVLTHVCSADDYRLGADDVLAITVYREKDLERRVRVSSNGYISFPLVGRIKAEGLTALELENAIAEGLRKYFKDPQVTVFINRYATITVTGQVVEPGSYSLKGELTVVEAIGLAGGFTKIANRSRVTIMRLENGEKKTITVNVADIQRQGDKTKDVPLKRGDIVFVPESLL